MKMNRGRKPEKTLLFAKKGEETPRPYQVSTFKKITTLRYCNHLFFASEKVRADVQARCSIVRLSVRAKRMGRLWKCELANGYVAPVSIRWRSDYYGYGLFAEQDLAAGEFVGEYVGMVRKVGSFFSNVNAYCFRYPLYGFGFWAYTIDAELYCNETSFINHSDKPNCDAIVAYSEGLLHVVIAAKRAIKCGEEMTFDYGNKRWTS